MNQKLNPKVQAVMRVLLDGGVKAAQEYVETHISPDVAKAKQILEEKLQEESAVRNIILMAMQSMPPSQSAQEPDEEPPMDVRGRVLGIAAEVARQNNGIANLDAVVAAVEKQGLNLNSSRPGTSIANILYKASVLWGRKEPGVFFLKS